MVRETNNPGIVMTLGYTNGNELVEIPPKEKAKDNFKKEFMTQELLTEMEKKNETMVLCKAEHTPDAVMKKVETIKNYGIREMPTGATWNKTIRPEKIGKNGTDMIID